MLTEEKPWKVTLELCRSGDTSEFSFELREYDVRHSNAERRKAEFDWQNPDFLRALEQLEKGSRKSEVLLRVGQHLRKFLEPTQWALEEQKIEQALQAGRRIDLTIRSNAPEIHALPWSLLVLRPRERALGDIKHCHIQYEVLPLQPPVQSRATGRILLASSAAGGTVPFKQHLNAIQAACEGTSITFEPSEDVLPNLTMAELASALRETRRPVTVLHLLCHGAPKGNGSYGLVLHSSDHDKERETLDSVELQRLIPAGTSSLRLVVLCACHSGDAGQPGHLVGGIARRIHLQGVPAVIASRLPLSPEGSNILSQSLYQELLQGSGNLRTALANAREKLFSEQGLSDWAALQLYARKNDENALHPFSPPSATTGTRDLVLIRHESYSKAPGAPGPADAPALFEGRKVRKQYSIDQTQTLAKRQWKNLRAEVKRLVSSKGELQRALAEPDAEFIYYGFPYVPFAALAGHLAKTHVVHLLEHDRVKQRFTWEQETDSDYPSLKVESELRESGKAVRLRLSVSAPVDLDACREVLPEEDVRLDLHLRLESPEPGAIRWHEQFQEYARTIRQALHEHVARNGPVLESLHVFAAVPVSIAFWLGRELAATWLPRSYVYNFGKDEMPRYKWRLYLQAAAAGRPAVHVFKPVPPPSASR